MSKPLLFSYFQSSCSWRVRTALAMKEIDYDYKAVNLLKGEQLTDEYKQRNPMGVVPALTIDGVTLTSSLPIIEYLEETRPNQGVPLLPRDPKLRAKARSIANMIACDIQPVQNLRVLKKYGLEKKLEWGGHWIRLGFTAVENVLESTAGKYCVGDEVTIADLCLVPQCYNAKRFEVNLSDYPNIDRINSALLELPAFQEAHPFRQPDTPEEMRQLLDNGDKAAE